MIYQKSQPCWSPIESLLPTLTHSLVNTRGAARNLWPAETCLLPLILTAIGLTELVFVHFVLNSSHDKFKCRNTRMLFQVCNTHGHTKSRDPQRVYRTCLDIFPRIDIFGRWQHSRESTFSDDDSIPENRHFRTVTEFPRIAIFNILQKCRISWLSRKLVIGRQTFFVCTVDTVTIDTTNALGMRYWQEMLNLGSYIIVGYVNSGACAITHQYQIPRMNISEQ